MFGKNTGRDSIEDAIHRVHTSLNRSLAHSRFIEIFYEIFMATDAEIRQMFEHTEFERQKKLLRKALLSAVTFAAGGEVARQRLALIRESHNRKHMNVRPELYGLWTNSLVKAVAQCDPNFDQQLDREWRAVLQPAIEFIAGGYLD